MLERKLFEAREFSSREDFALSERRGLYDLPSAAFTNMMHRVRRLARDRSAPIILEGESGSGKTQLARRIHDLSPRASGPFVAVRLNALVDELSGSELFGHVAGAFTGARERRSGLFVSASGGTLFLDELGKASPTVQMMLLDAIESREIRPLGADRAAPVDVRIIGATNVPLEKMIADYELLPDLFARLELFRVQVPPLRHRRADIRLLVEHYVSHHAASCGYSAVPTVDADLLWALERAPWPRNLRQLDATVHRLMIQAEGASVLTLELCSDDLRYLKEGKRRGPLTDAEVKKALAKTESVTAAARMLGVHRSTIHRHLSPESGEVLPDDAY
jgi:DNA-binding NtrC family response regulator